MKRHAVFSDDGRHRFVLTREWAMEPDPGPYGITFIMLNPSTADGEKDDPTTRRCIDFARAGGYSRLKVVNLFSFRATDPDEFIKVLADETGECDPTPCNIIEESDTALYAACGEGRVCVAWGALGRHPLVAQRVAEVVRWLARIKPVCLGVTQDGHPRHPLMVLAKQKFEPWAGIKANAEKTRGARRGEAG